VTGYLHPTGRTRTRAEVEGDVSTCASIGLAQLQERRAKLAPPVLAHAWHPYRAVAFSERPGETRDADAEEFGVECAEPSDIWRPALSEAEQAFASIAHEPPLGPKVPSEIRGPSSRASPVLWLPLVLGHNTKNVAPWPSRLSAVGARPDHEGGGRRSLEVPRTGYTATANSNLNPGPHGPEPSWLHVRPDPPVPAMLLLNTNLGACVSAGYR
jgi:hypothetical protein